VSQFKGITQKAFFETIYRIFCSNYRSKTTNSSSQTQKQALPNVWKQKPSKKSETERLQRRNLQELNGGRKFEPWKTFSLKIRNRSFICSKLRVSSHN
jgi:hypothetical protein